MLPYSPADSQTTFLFPPFSLSCQERKSNLCKAKRLRGNLIMGQHCGIGVGGALLLRRRR